MREPFTHDLCAHPDSVPHPVRAGGDQARDPHRRSCDPGQALVETELAAQFGVSKTPVREALKTLAGTGLVVMSQYKGVTVRMVDAAMAREVYDVRLLLEPEALRRTIAREGVAGRGRRRRWSGPTGAADQADRSLANRDFHRALYLPCGNPLLARMLDEVRDQAALVSTVAWAAIPSWEREAPSTGRSCGSRSPATRTARGRGCCTTTSRRSSAAPSPTTKTGVTRRGRHRHTDERPVRMDLTPLRRPSPMSWRSR